MSHEGEVSDTQPVKDDVPLCVGLNDKVVKTNLSWESVVLLIKHKPLLLFVLPFWALRGGAFMKRKVAERVVLQADLLPYDKDVVTYIQEQKEAGRKVVLVTASDEMVAQLVSDHTGLFDEVIASDGIHNCDGQRKRARLVSAFGKGGFDYLGGTSNDFALWEDARHAIVVTQDSRFLASVESRLKPHRIFFHKTKKSVLILRAMRVYQWVKNVLLVVPLVMAHEVANMQAFGRLALAFLAFSLCASSVYLLNDLCDLEADRHHHRKKHRPFASGKLPLSTGLALVPLLLLAAAVISSLLPTAFWMALIIYYIITCLYSFSLKQMPVLDVMTLASLYTLRVLAGAFATEVVVSEWLLAFSLFFFMSLACVKRCSELVWLQRRRDQAGATHAARGRGYFADDLLTLSQFGTSAGYLSVLVMALYVKSDEVAKLYSHPVLLWLICPLLLYWVSRVWFGTHRGMIHEDPVVFALSDRVSYVVGLLILVIMIGAL